jgi:mannose/fructose/N-acetylgalactosamine-specific phosphotransferase system component IIC
MVLIRAVEVAGGALAVSAAGALIVLQTVPTPETFKEYGIPLAYLLLTIAVAGLIIRVLWMSNQRKDEKMEQKDLRMEAMTKEFSATVKAMSEQHTAAFNKLSEEFRTRRANR